MKLLSGIQLRMYQFSKYECSVINGWLYDKIIILFENVQETQVFEAVECKQVKNGTNIVRYECFLACGC